MFQFLRRYLVCAKGATAVEYTLMVAGISLAIVAVVFIFGDNLQVLYQTVSDAFASNL